MIAPCFHIHTPLIVNMGIATHMTKLEKLGFELHGEYTYVPNSAAIMK